MKRFCTTESHNKLVQQTGQYLVGLYWPVLHV